MQKTHTLKKLIDDNVEKCNIIKQIDSGFFCDAKVFVTNNIKHDALNPEHFHSYTNPFYFCVVCIQQMNGSMISKQLMNKIFLEHFNFFSYLFSSFLFLLYFRCDSLSLQMSMTFTTK